MARVKPPFEDVSPTKNGYFPVSDMLPNFFDPNVESRTLNGLFDVESCTELLATERGFRRTKKRCQAIPGRNGDVKLRQAGLQKDARWWFQICFIFTPTWGRFPF